MKKKLLAIILCAVLLTGVCATSFAAKDIRSVMRLALSKRAQANDEEIKRGFHDVKHLLREAYQNFSNLSEPTLNSIKNNIGLKLQYDSIPIGLAILEKYGDDDDVRKWERLFDLICEKINNISGTVRLYIYERHPLTWGQEPDFRIASESHGNTVLAKQIVLELHDKSHPKAQLNTKL